MRDAGLLDAMREAVQKPAGSRAVTLPGFHLADRSAVSPYEWCIPRPSDLSDLVNVYEEYVDRPLGKVRLPDTVAKRLYQTPALAVRYFGGRKRANAWRLPATKLVLVAQHFGAIVERGPAGAVSTEVEGYRFEVTSRGCYSNTHGKFMSHRSGGPAHEGLAVPELRTRNPVAIAMTDLGADIGGLWALSSVLRARAYRNLPMDTLLVPPPRVSPGRVRDPQQVREALLEATDLAEQCMDAVLVQLHAAMVPRLCGIDDFKKTFGNPYAAYARKRGVKVETRQAWVLKIQQLAEEALNAVA